MNESKLHTVVGLFVLAGLAAVTWLALKIGAGSFVGGDTYLVQARFTNIGGLNPGANVTIAGVPVGRVDRVQMDPRDFSAVVDLRIRRGVQLPTDSIASIRTSGLIGDKFVAIAPGADEDTIAPGGRLTETESAVDLESLISRFAFGNVKDSASGK